MTPRSLPRDVLDRLLAPWEALAGRADAFFQRVHREHGTLMACGAGCSSCCGRSLDLLPLEALALQRALRDLPEARRRALAARGDVPCPLLEDGLCLLYEARPLLCRTHGLPVLYREGELSCCHLNFGQEPPPSGSVLDGDRLYRALFVADALAREELGLDAAAPRIPITTVLTAGI